MCIERLNNLNDYQYYRLKFLSPKHCTGRGMGKYSTNYAHIFPNKCKEKKAKKNPTTMSFKNPWEKNGSGKSFLINNFLFFLKLKRTFYCSGD